MSEAEQSVVQAGRKISSVWLIPLIALILGAWMVVDHVRNRGPIVNISFATAEGITAGKTRVKALSVDIGIVQSVRLNDSMDGVVVTVRLDKDVQDLLRDDSRFWVVRPRIGAAGVSGLGTLLSGAYIELSPGSSDAFADEFSGLEEIPVTPAGTPGLHITLKGDVGSSLHVGDPVLYRGFTVGRIESVDFNPFERESYYQLFIREPYNHLITKNTYFWKTNGLQIDASADGINIRTGSLESMINGGIAFDVPEDLPVGDAVSNQAEFRLYANQKETRNRRYEHFQDYVLLFKDSIRGLVNGAPVEYRGVRIGTVLRNNLDYAEVSDIAEDENRIPVLVRIDPPRIGMPDTPESVTQLKQDMQEWVDKGLRASLKTGNLLTGRLFVDLDFYDDLNTDVSRFGGYPTIPSVSNGLSQITAKIDSVLGKLEALPLDSAVRQADKALLEIQRTTKKAGDAIREAESLLAQDSTRQVPAEVNQTLNDLSESIKGVSPDSPLYQELEDSMKQLQQVLWDLQPLIKDLRNKPNSLIFSGQQQDDPEP